MRVVDRRRWAAAQLNLATIVWLGCGVWWAWVVGAGGNPLGNPIIVALATLSSAHLLRVLVTLTR